MDSFNSMLIFCVQDSAVFSSIDACEYIADLWRNPDPSAKENLHKFENVST